MESQVNQTVNLPYLALSANPEAQRAAIAAARSSGSFNGSVHLAASPIGQAVAGGLPLANRSL